MSLDDAHRASLRKRLLIVTALLALAAVAAASEWSRQGLNELVALAEQIVLRHPRLGMIAFVAVSALSAILAFFSSAIVVPVGVKAWGEGITFVLLWIGWLLGGMATYAVGRFLGRPAVRLLVSEDRVRYYETRLSRKAGFPLILLFQLAVPSEIPGYVLGTARYRFLTYLAALALAELPFAIGAVFLGASLMSGSYILLLIVGLAGLGLTAWAMVYLHRRLHRDEGLPEFYEE